MKKILNKFLYLSSKTIARFLAWIFFRLKVEGRNNLPRKGPYIVASNHASFLDPGVVQVAIPAKISWIARRDVYEKWFLKPLHYICDSIPINGAVEKALAALEQGRVLGVFPEGTRSPNGRLKEADVGVAILALKSGRPVVPVGIKGSFEAYPPGKKIFKPYPIIVKIGKPLSFEKEDREIIEESLIIERRDFIMERIRQLLV